MRSPALQAGLFSSAMKNYVSSAIIMRTKEFGETDLLVDFFTRDKGRLKGVAKGGRRSRKRFVNCLDIFSLVNLEYTLKREGDLYFLQSGRLIDAFPGIRSDYGALSRASYMVELTEILFPWGVSDQEMFELLKGSLGGLARKENVDRIPIAFGVRAMARGGYAIRFDRCSICGRLYRGKGRAVFKQEKGGIACLRCQQESAVCPGLSPEAVKMLELMQSKPFPELKALKLTREILEEIKPVLRQHMDYHLGQRMKTASYLE